MRLQVEPREVIWHIRFFGTAARRAKINGASLNPQRLGFDAVAGNIVQGLAAAPCVRGLRSFDVEDTPAQNYCDFGVYRV